MSLIEKLPDLNAVKGGFGERLAAYYSKTVFSDSYVLHDVLIDGKDEHKSQIDLIIIAASGIYVVEVKTFSDAKYTAMGERGIGSITSAGTGMISTIRLCRTKSMWNISKRCSLILLKSSSTLLC